MSGCKPGTTEETELGTRKCIDGHWVYLPDPPPVRGTSISVQAQEAYDLLVSRARDLDDDDLGRAADVLREAPADIVEGDHG